MPKITHFHEIARFSSFRDVVPGNVSLRGNSFQIAIKCMKIRIREIR
jgi:hypothetical protein